MGDGHGAFRGGCAVVDGGGGVVRVLGLQLLDLGLLLADHVEEAVLGGVSILFARIGIVCLLLEAVCASQAFDEDHDLPPDPLARIRAPGAAPPGSGRAHGGGCEARVQLLDFLTRGSAASLLGREWRGR